MPSDLGNILVEFETNSICNLIECGDVSTHQYDVIIEHIGRLLNLWGTKFVLIPYS